MESIISALRLHHRTFGKRPGHMVWRREEVVYGSDRDQDSGIRSSIARIEMRGSGCRVQGLGLELCGWAGVKQVEGVGIMLRKIW